MNTKSSWQNETIRITISNENTPENPSGLEQKLKDKHEGHHSRSESKHGDKKERDDRRHKKEKTRGHEGHHSKERVKVKIEHLEKDLEEYSSESKNEQDQKPKMEDVLPASKDSGKVSDCKSSARNSSLQVSAASDNHKSKITDDINTGQDGKLKKQDKLAKAAVAKVKEDEKLNKKPFLRPSRMKNLWKSQRIQL